MRVKPGDLCMVIKEATAIYQGVAFKLRYGTFLQVASLSIVESVRRRRWMWSLEAPFCIRSVDGRYTASLVTVCGSILKPIRPSDDQDEVLRIAGKPVEAVRDIVEG